MGPKKILRYVSALILTAFALLTLFLSSSVIFDWFGIRAKEGNYVLFIVWTNLISSILYLIAVYGFVKSKKWTFKILTVALVILIISFISLQFHINNGGIYEEKTIGAMVFRMLVTLSFSAVAYYFINKQIKET